MCRTFFLVTSFHIFLLPGYVCALTIQVGSGAEGTPPVFNYSSVSPVPLSLPVKVYNESMTTENIVVWQLELSIVKADSSTGDVEIVGFDVPNSPFLEPFGPSANPSNALPSNKVLLIDADMPLFPQLPGKDILASETRDLFNIQLSSPNNALGIFYLVLREFNMAGGSSWSGLVPPSRAFANVPGTTLPGEMVLAEIVFIPEPGGEILFIVGCATFGFLWRTTSG